MKQLKPMVFMTALALMAVLGASTLSLAEETHFAALDAINEVLTCFSGEREHSPRRSLKGIPPSTMSCHTTVCSGRSRKHIFTLGNRSSRVGLWSSYVRTWILRRQICRQIRRHVRCPRER